MWRSGGTIPLLAGLVIMKTSAEAVWKLYNISTHKSQSCVVSICTTVLILQVTMAIVCVLHWNNGIKSTIFFICFSYLLSQCWLRLVLLLFSEAHFQVLDISRWGGGIALLCATARNFLFLFPASFAIRNEMCLMCTTVNELNGQHRRTITTKRLFPVSDSMQVILLVWLNEM